MAWFQNVAIGIAVVVVAMACMVFGDWLQTSRKRDPNYDYCQYARNPEGREIAPTQDDATAKKKEASKTANERYHELCNQWRSAEYAQEAAHVAWIQLWFGLAGLGALIATVIFAAMSAKAAGDAAREMARDVDIQMHIEGPLLFVDSVRADPKDPFEVTVRVKNVGKTPAIFKWHFADCRVDAALPTTPTYDSVLPIPVNALLEHGAPGLPFPVFVRSTGGLASAYGDGDGKAVLLWGYIDYEDVFGRRRRWGFGRKGVQIPFSEPGDTPSLYWIVYGGEAYNYDREQPPEKAAPKPPPLVAFAP